tara:strand:+ start:2331 stop:2924 length:594 start_codon:yes stop_codon:yes gene_type:complete
MTHQPICFTDRLLWESPTALPDAMIDSIIDHCSNLTYETAQTGNHTEKNEELKKWRNTDVAWIAWDEWIAGIIHNQMILANNAYFNYDLTQFDSKIQVTVYNGEENQHYNWHVDNGTNVLNDPEQERKLSCSLVLNDPDEYEGGEIQFHYHNAFYQSIKPPKGTAIIFPAWLPHRVRPVRKGKRTSLVAWMRGPFFK